MALVKVRVTDVGAGVVLVRAFKLTCCRLPVLLEPNEIAMGLATAKARGAENAALISLAALLKGLIRKRSPAATGLLKEMFRPSIVARIGAFVGGV